MSRKPKAEAANIVKQSGKPVSQVAKAMSFFGTLKPELVHSKTVIAEWIEVFCNRQRIDSTSGFLFPVQFEDQYWLFLKQSIAV